MNQRTYLAVVSVLILVGTVFNAAMVATATTIDTTGAGKSSIDIVFPQGGGSISAATLKVPFNVYVLEALLALEGKPSPLNSTISWKTKADMMKALMENVTVINGDIVLGKLFGNWTSPPGWPGADMKNLTLDQKKAVLAKLVGTYFLPGIKVDTGGIADPGKTDMFVGKDGVLHVLYTRMAQPPQLYYVRSADGGKTWDLVKSFSANGFVYPHIYLGPQGYIHILYNIVMMGGTPLVYQRSEDNGTTFETVSGSFQAQDVRVVFDQKGVMHFAGFVSQPYPPFENRLYYWNSTDNGTTLSKPVQVSDDPDNNSMKDGVNIAIDANGKVHIIWEDFRDSQNGDDGEVFYTGSVDHENFSYNIALTAQTAVFGGYPDMVIDSFGTVHVVWADDSAGTMAVYYSRSTDGGGHFIPARAIDAMALAPQSCPSVALGPDGSLQVVFVTGVDIMQGVVHYTYSLDNGTTFSQEVTVRDEVHPSGQYPLIIIDTDGTPDILWTDSSAGGPDLYFTRTYEPYAATGELQMIADLGVAPAELLHIVVDAALTASTEVQVRIRTSSDNKTWSAWETLGLDIQVIHSMAQRYVNIDIVLVSQDGLETPSVTGIKLDYSQYNSAGTWVSDAAKLAHGMKDATVTWETTNGQLLTMFVSNDNGTTWFGALSGQKVNFPKADDRLRVKAVFSSEGNVTPEVSSITVECTTEVYPTDLSLDLGADGTVDWNMTGELGSKVQINITKALADYLDTYAGMLDPVPVVLKFYSKTAGVLTVSNISVVVDLPPVIGSYGPVIDTPRTGQGATMDFKVVAADPDGKDLSYKWYVNGTQVPGVLGPGYVFNATYDKIGDYVIKVEVSDGRFVVNRTWTLTVDRTNRAPVITGYDPLNASFERFEGVLTTFDVMAYDPDGDALSYVWTVDGVTVPMATKSSWAADYGLLVAGKTYRLMVTVSDGQKSANRTWTMTVKSHAAPRIDAWTPQGNVTMDLGKTVTVGVDAVHPDGLGMFYTWYVNGKTVTGSPTMKNYTFDGKTAGTYAVKVVVSDGKREASHEWTVTVNKKKAGSSNMSMVYGLVAVLAIVGAIVGVALYRRGGKK